jgi:hypothetical protein
MTQWYSHLHEKPAPNGTQGSYFARLVAAPMGFYWRGCLFCTLYRGFWPPKINIFCQFAPVLKKGRKCDKNGILGCICILMTTMFFLNIVNFVTVLAIPSNFFLAWLGLILHPVIGPGGFCLGGLFDGFCLGFKLPEGKASNVEVQLWR